VNKKILLSWGLNAAVTLFEVLLLFIFLSLKKTNTNLGLWKALYYFQDLAHQFCHRAELAGAVPS